MIQSGSVNSMRRSDHLRSRCAELRRRTVPHKNALREPCRFDAKTIVCDPKIRSAPSLQRTRVKHSSPTPIALIVRTRTLGLYQGRSIAFERRFVLDAFDPWPGDHSSSPSPSRAPVSMLAINLRSLVDWIGAQARGPRVQTMMPFFDGVIRISCGRGDERRRSSMGPNEAAKALKKVMGSPIGVVNRFKRQLAERNLAVRALIEANDVDDLTDMIEREIADKQNDDSQIEAGDFGTLV
jgi:hypothetical protein